MAAKFVKAEHRTGPHSGYAEGDGAFAPTAPIEAWFQAQAEFAAAAEPLVRGWLDRRAEAARGLMDSYARLAACRDLGEASSIHAEWFEGAMRRLGADLQALAEHSRATAQCALRPMKQMSESWTEATARAAEPRPAETDRAIPHAA
jgi:Phasin protein